MYAPHVLPAASDYDALYRAFRWQVPAHYNIGVDVCDRWAASEPGRIAIFHVGANGAVQEISYGALRGSSNRLANALAADIKGFVRTRLSAHEYPREVAFIEHMPMTTTGKVIRRLLRERA